MKIQLGGLHVAELAAQLQRSLLAVPRSQFVDVTSNATSDDPFIVAHNLGIVPRFASATGPSSNALYWTADDKKEWSRSQIKVRWPVASEMLVVKIEAE